MKIEVEKLSDLAELTAKLLTTLDEKKFFKELCEHISSKLGTNRYRAFQVFDNNSIEEIDIDNTGKCETYEGGEGLAGHVVKTKSPYFSNNISRDPLFAKFRTESTKAELCHPVSHEGVVIATLHFMADDSSEKNFAREDIIAIKEILNGLKTPLSNMKMYLTAKSLNAVLMRKIEAKESEILESNTKPSNTYGYTIKDPDIVFKSNEFKRIVQLSDKLAFNNVNMIIYGESGVGKELIAKRIHARSERKEQPYINFDCLFYSEAEMEECLFGIEKIEESGNVIEKKGHLELASEGTLVIENIDKMPISTQSKVLNVIKNGCATRVGCSKSYGTKVRIIALSSKKIDESVNNGKFIEELFYKLSTIILDIPSLETRCEDVEELANHFLNRNKDVVHFKSFSPGAVRVLKEYHWPGNVRELQNVCERAYIISDGIIVEKNHLGEIESQIKKKEEVKKEDEVYHYQKMTLNELEKRHICQTLKFLAGNKTKTAKSLGITVKTLYNKLHAYGMIESRES